MLDPTSFISSTTSITDRLTIIPDTLKEEVLFEQEGEVGKNYMRPKIMDLYLLRSFIVGGCDYQVYSSTKDIVDCKKLSLQKNK